MNNDLISREALRNEIDSWGCNDYDKYDFLEAIDNAPTVEPDMEFAKECYANGYEDGNNERPQGEWIFTDDDYGFWHCNQCKAIGSPHNNFCPNCGAKMRKGGAE